VAYGSVSRGWTGNFVPPASQTVGGIDRQGAFGWAAGAGAEWMVSQHWVLGAEYLYLKLNSRTFTATGAASAGCTAANCNFNVAASGLSANIVRLKLDYKF
jgi:opacity protein-like surface antigen